MNNTIIKTLLLCVVASLASVNLMAQQNEIEGTLTINQQYTLPSTDGTVGQVLSTDGNGTTTWVTGGSGSSPWTVSGTNVYRAAGRVGIGTTSPLDELQVEAAAGTSNIRIKSPSGAGYILNYEGSNLMSQIGFSGSNLIMSNNHPTGDAYLISKDDFFLQTGGSTKFMMNESGDIGLGTVTPGSKFHMDVTGSDGIYIEGNNTGDTRFRMNNGGGNHYLFDDVSDGNALKLESAGDFAINVNGTNQKFRIDGPTGDIDMYDNVDISGQLTVSNDLELRGGDPTLDFWNNSPPGVGARIKFDDNSSSGGNSGILEISNFQIAGSIEIKNGSQLNMRMNDTNMYAYTDLSPFVHKGVDLGLSGKAWDNVYADDYINQGAAAFNDRVLTEELLAYPLVEKKEGMFDYMTERGDIELDPSFLPPGLSENDGILIDEMAAYNYKANYEQQQQIAELQAENAELKKQLEEVLILLRK